MNGTCIYCGQAPSTRKGDHVPPQCFFGASRGHHLIQVPCCQTCNVAFSRDDERVRNLLTCVDVAESHPLVQSELRDKRNRSLVQVKKDGTKMDSNLRHLMASSSVKTRFTPGGASLGPALALNFDQPVIHRFLHRMTRALHHHTYGSGYVECDIQDSNVFGPEISQVMADYRPTSHGTLGDEVFTYAGYTAAPTEYSLWYMQFFGAEFWTTLTPRHG